MKNIFLLNETGSSFNGVGTYICEMKRVLWEISDLKLNIILFNANVFEFEVRRDKDITYFLIPRFNDYKFVPYSFQIITLLSLYIRDSRDNIFVINHGPSLLLIESIKKYFVLSKTIFVVHNFSWSETLLGDVEKLKKIVYNKSNYFHYKDLVNDFQQEEMMYNKCDKIVCLCKDAYEVVTEIYNISEQKVCVINNTIKSINTMTQKEINDFKEDRRIVSDRMTLISASRISKVKGTDILVNSVIHLIESGIDCQLIIAGSNNVPQWILDLTRIYPGRFIYIGFVESSELSEWYQIADIGVLPSYCEQCSFTGLEMLKLGLPIVGTNGFGIGNMFMNDRNAIVANIEREKSSEYFQHNLTLSLKRMIASKSIRNYLSMHAKEDFHKRYNFKNTVDLYNDCFMSLY